MPSNDPCLHSAHMPASNNDGGAVPFVKWVGGKRSILSELTGRLPVRFNNYYEPFVGGGALFFELCNRLPRKAFLMDSNLELIFTYKAVQKEPRRLIEILREHARRHCREYYYKIRGQHDLSDPVAIAARFIYLNKTCYNGLYRVNKAGRFNVPVGAYSNPNIVQEQNIMACHEALRGTAVYRRDFRQFEAQRGDFVYFDPPYHPLDTTSRFTSYTRQSFTEKDQADLRDLALRLHKKGVLIMLSNSNTPFIRDLYKSNIFKPHIVKAPRFVNCKADSRSAVEEVLIVNY